LSLINATSSIRKATPDDVFESLGTALLNINRYSSLKQIKQVSYPFREGFQRIGKPVDRSEGFKELEPPPRHFSFIPCRATVSLNHHLPLV
jgi:hypothetical protein